ncbi:MAG: alpha/beta hydrolase [Planctomycetaceae bacterium]|jgi:acetyl esterase/lipase|nr:alpha/beta hydrolase [Planctomycetaceae bacterium]
MTPFLLKPFFLKPLPSQRPRVHATAKSFLYLVIVACSVGWNPLGHSTTWSQARTEVEFEVQEDYIYGRKDGMALTLDVVRPAEPNGIGLCFMVSGGWNSMWFPPRQFVRDSLYQSLLKSGYTLFLVRHGSAPRYKVPEAVDDVRLAIKKIRDQAANFGVDPNKLGAFGGSAGGHLSIMLGTTGVENQRVAAVAAYFPPTNLNGYVDDPKFRADFPALVFDRALVDPMSPELQATSDDAPILMIHGDQDTLVPLVHSEKLKAKLDEQSVANELIVIENAGHAFTGDDKKRAEQALLAWFDKHLRGL